MTGKACRRLIEALPSMTIGAAAMVGLVASSSPQNWGTYSIVGCAIIGAVIGRYLWSCGRGLVIALHSGATMRVLLWAIVGAAAGALMGYFAWHDTAGHAALPRILISGSASWAMLRCALVFALLAALGIGYDFRPRPPQNAPLLPQPEMRV